MTMMEETSESIGSGSAPAALALAAATGNSTTAAGTNPRQQHKKVEVYNEILRRLKESDNPEVLLPGFDDELWAHFTRLPVRYALDVNVERAEDVLTHKRLLQLARDSDNRPAFDVRLVQVLPPSELTSSNPDDTKGSENGPSQTSSPHSSRLSIHPPPAFGSSANLEMLALEVPKSNDGDENSRANASSRFFRPMHEITFSTDDKPKVLSQLTSLLGEIGLNIEEAHAFSTTDGFSLDVFVVDGWEHEETQQLRALLKEEIMKIEKGPWPFLESSSPSSEHEQIGSGYKTDHVEIPNDGTDVWEINLKHRKLGTKVASGSYGDLYKGTYCSQEVAVKILKAERINTDLQKEFAQEVFIMRKVRHKNVVQFIGACTKPPSLCIVTEFMSCGSVYDYLHKCTFKLPSLLKVAIDVSKGMNYLHQNNIIHRDLKAANLLMDENEEWKLGYHSFWIQEVMMSAMIFHVVKVADFGVVRVKAQTGVMTSEIGTYRWMAPEVIEHKPYDHKADVFSFGIVVWELLTGKLPYDYLTPLQAAVAVVQKGLRPTIPKNTPPKLAELLERCWQQDPALRPDFSEILEVLQKIAKEVGDGDDRNKDKHTGVFSAFRRNHH